VPGLPEETARWLQAESPAEEAAAAPLFAQPTAQQREADRTFRAFPSPFRPGVPAMSCRHLSLLLVFVCLAGPAQAQKHGEETELIEPPATPERPDVAKPDLARVNDEIIRLTNEFRRQEGCPEVQRNPQLTAAAQDFAEYMARTDRFGHTADGTHPWDRAKKHGYAYSIVSENIAYFYNSAGYRTEELAREIVEGWKHSPGHRKNMLDPDVADIGVAVAHSKHTGYYYAEQLFGRPHSKRIEFKISNRADTTVKYQLGERTYALPPRYTRTHILSRPAELKLRSSSGETLESFKPVNGSRYLVEQGSDGTIQFRSE
jgi:uncharacterized protein YkwD